MAKEYEFLPDCWDDDERMGYLFSGFRGNRQVNPRDWDNKLKFWSELVLNVGRTEKSLILSMEDLSQKFRRKEVVPQCLGGVLKEMHRSGQIVKVDDLKASDSWLSWGVNTLIRRPLSWTMNSFLRRTDQPPEGHFIAEDLLKEFGTAFVKRHHANVQCASTDHIVDYSTFKEECEDLCRDSESFDLVLMHLQRRKNIIVTIDDGAKVIKFAAKGQKAVSPITSTEIGTLRLKKTIASMQLTTERLSGKILQGDVETRQYLRKGMKTSAKSALKRKKQAEKRLANTENTLDTLQHLYDKLQSAESEKMIMDAYKSGAKALKRTFADNGLTPEALDDAISDVQEVMDMCNEIDDTIVQGNKSIDETVSFGADIDIDALESELEALVGDQGETSAAVAPSVAGDASTLKQEDAKKNSILLDLPEVPSESPAELDTSGLGESIRESMLAS